MFSSCNSSISAFISEADSVVPKPGKQYNQQQHNQRSNSNSHIKPPKLNLNVSNYNFYEASTVIFEKKEESNSLTNTVIYFNNNSCTSLHDRLPTPRITSRYLHQRHSSVPSPAELQMLNDLRTAILPSAAPPLPSTATSLISNVNSLTYRDVSNTNLKHEDISCQDTLPSLISSSNTASETSSLGPVPNNTRIIFERNETPASVAIVNSSIQRKHSFKTQAGRSNSFSEFEYLFSETTSTPDLSTPEMPFKSDNLNATSSISKLLANFSWTNKKKKQLSNHDEESFLNSMPGESESKPFKSKTHRFLHAQKPISDTITPYHANSETEMTKKSITRKPVSNIPTLSPIMTDHSSVDSWTNFFSVMPEFSGDSAIDSTNSSQEPANGAYHKLPANTNNSVSAARKSNTSNACSTEGSKEQKSIERLQHNYNMLLKKVKQLRQQKQLIVDDKSNITDEQNISFELELVEKQRHEAGILLSRAYKRQRDRSGETEFWVRSVGIN